MWLVTPRATEKPSECEATPYEIRIPGSTEDNRPLHRLGSESDPHRETMQEVAHHLQIYAQKYAGSGRDAFARSAYNRYYYACFLKVREILASMNIKWSGIHHKDYPLLLNGQIRERFIKERRRANKSGDHELSSKISSALRAIPKLSEIMASAYGARVVADYRPETPIVFSKIGRFSLNSIDITEAHKWHGNVNILSITILSAWQQIDA